MYQLRIITQLHFLLLKPFGITIQLYRENKFMRCKILQINKINLQHWRIKEESLFLMEKDGCDYFYDNWHIYVWPELIINILLISKA